MEFGDYPAQSVDADQQWLTTVQHNLDEAQVMLYRVFGDPLRGSPKHVVREPLGPPTPTLICCLVHVAVITGQITATLYLEYEVIKREVWSAHAGPRS
jgi:hypothetical protein